MSVRGDRHTEQVRELKRELREKALLLANLDVIIEDYRREKRGLLEEIIVLRERLWDLSGQEDAEEVSGGVED
ncbi:MAG TPA: hypothetical protein VMW79_11040 [Anaerolineae bacterium]|nr:hypothetical protein [Anaerolineae bacterium]